MDNKKLYKEFPLSSWAIDNKTTVYVLMFIILTLGIGAYFGLSRETFPEAKETKIFVSVVYPGNTAEDIERLIIDPLEDTFKNVSNVSKFSSTSQEDFGLIIVEFDENITVEEAKQKIKDDVDAKKAGEDWPTFNGAKVEPNVFSLNISEEFPIGNISVSGDYPVQKLKEFAEYLQDKIEDLPEIKQADLRGVQDKEVEVAVDMFKMTAAKVSFGSIINAIKNGNVTISAGNIITSGQRRTIRILGEINSPKDLENFVVKSNNGIVYLKDVATVTFKEKQRTSYARDFGKDVVMLDIKKRSGKNMVEAVAKIRTIISDTQKNVFPEGVAVNLSNDQSAKTVNNVDDLVNNIIFGISLVVIVLMFFLGFRNALFVGFAIPLSMFMSFLIISALGYTLNTMILFGLIMGLGMLVDNGIVVVENVYRLMEEEGMSRIEAAKKGIGEIALPIIISTATTVAAFVPLGMWPGIMGEFMKYFPITLSIVLGSSLFVAIFINSMLVSQFMKTEEEDLSVKALWKITLIMGSLGLVILFLGGSYRGLGSLMIFTVLMFWLYKYLLKNVAHYFQRVLLVKLENVYKRFLHFALSGKKPVLFVVGNFALLFLVFMLFGKSIESERTQIEFFPDNTPNQIIIYIEYPQGTDIEKTNRLTQAIEKRVYAVLTDKQYYTGDYNFMVEAAISQVGEGANNPHADSGNNSEMPHRAKITITLREFKYRHGKDSELLRKNIQKQLKGIYPGVVISVEKDPVGPPVGYPINIEIKGNDYDRLIKLAEKMKNFINSKNVAGVDELKIDVNKSKPAMKVFVDRKKAGELGVAVGQVGQQLRQSVFGSKAGIYKKDGDDYDIYVRFNKADKYNRSILFNQNLIFRDQATGRLKEIPIASVVTHKNSASFSAIKHKEGKRVVTVYSALEAGYKDAAAVISHIRREMENFEKLPDDITIDYTGQIEEQNKQQAFLNKAFLYGIGLIFLLLVFQFNSVSKPTIIMVAILLSFIGVFGGILISGSSFVIMMTMMGIIALAGIVVNNGVVLLDYTQLLIDRKLAALGKTKTDLLSKEDVKLLIVQAGRARLRPVLLTAITTVLGLVPLAIGFNIDFFSLFSEFNPNIYLGGDNVIFWGPLAKTVIYGLLIATFLTLVIVPVLFYLSYRIKMSIRKWSE